MVGRPRPDRGTYIGAGCNATAFGCNRLLGNLPHGNRYQNFLEICFAGRLSDGDDDVQELDDFIGNQSQHCATVQCSSSAVRL
jgi:hypothetical protein